MILRRSMLPKWCVQVVLPKWRCRSVSSRFNPTCVWHRNMDLGDMVAGWCRECHVFHRYGTEVSASKRSWRRPTQRRWRRFKPTSISPRSVNGSSDGRIMMMMAPSVTPVFTQTSFKAIRDAVIELGTATHIHVQAGTRPNHIALIHEQWGMGEAQLLVDRGLLDQPLFGAHCSGLTNLREDLKIMAHPNFTFVHCPSAGGAGQSPSQQIYPEALAAQVNTSIGFDTHSNDYIENIKQATIQGRARMLLLHKTSPVRMKDPTVWDALNSATLAGARGLKRKDLGRIEAGAKADLSTVDVSGLLVGNGISPRDPWNNLLYANGLSVRNVMIDGVWKVRDGALSFENERKLRERGGAAAKKIWDKMESEGFFVDMHK
jgi:5-methylthioadenosine/S-adenosylhomocysteine deaminase